MAEGRQQGEVEAQRYGGGGRTSLWIEKTRSLLPQFVVEKIVSKPLVVAGGDQRTAGMELIPLSERKRKGQNIAIR